MRTGATKNTDGIEKMLKNYQNVITATRLDMSINNVTTESGNKNQGKIVTKIIKRNLIIDKWTTTKKKIHKNKKAEKNMQTKS